MAARATVVWPDAGTAWPAGLTVYPKRVPPLRSDRDTVVIGTMTGKEPLDLKIAATGPRGAEQLSWTVQPGESLDGNSYLVQLVDQAQADGGCSVPIGGSASLDEARQAVNAGSRGLNQLARQALAAGNVEAPSGWPRPATRPERPGRPGRAGRSGEASRRSRRPGRRSAGRPGQAGPALGVGGAGDLNLVGGGGGGNPLDAFAADARLPKRSGRRAALPSRC